MDNFDLLNPVQRYLLAGERVLWTGQPKQGLAFSGKDVFLIPFSLMWGGFAFFWNGAVWLFPRTAGSSDWFMRLWGMPFLIIGLYMIFGRFIHDAVIRKSLFYAVTDRRVLVLRNSRSPKFNSLDIQRLPKIELSEYRDGTGSIAFEGDNSLFGAGRNGIGTWVPALSNTTQFFRITNPRQVYEMVYERSRLRQ